MQIIENDKIKEKLYIKKLENGLTVMVMPKKGVTKKYAIIGTHYGSIDSEFIIPGDDEKTSVPDGIAHYLEHKMFEQENGTNSLDTLTALGVSANAYTTNDHTAYLFEATDNFYEALDELLNYVQHPYFTDENVEKERGIIGQEIMMYNDTPEAKVYLNVLQNMYQKHPIRIDVAGTKESIARIDKEVLYKCYNTFYHPSNMAMVLCGDFEPEAIIKEVENRMVKREKQAEIKRIYPEEPEEICREYIEEHMEISIPLFVIGIKDIVKQENVKRNIAIDILLKILLGKSSKLYSELYQENLIQEELSTGYESTQEYAHVLIQGQSQSPEILLNKLKIAVDELKQNGIDECDFNRIRKVIYADFIKAFNSVEEIAVLFLSSYFRDINVFKYLEEFNNITKEYTEQVLKDVFRADMFTLSVIRK